MDFITKRVKTITLILKALVILSLFLIYPVLSAYPDMDLVSNPGFENGTTAPLNWTFVSQDGNTPIWSNISYSGSKSIEINIPGTTDLNSGFVESDRIIAQPFTTYTFSTWGKTQGADGTNLPTIRLGELDENMNLLRLTGLPLFSRGTHDWEQRSLEFQTGSNTSYIYIYANIWGGYGTFWMDDVTLSIKTNLAINPGFESGTTAPLNWTFVSQDGNTPIWSNISHNGSKSVEINIPGNIDLISGYLESERIGAQPFMNYTFSAWGKTLGANGTNIPTITFGELDADKNLLRLTNLPLFSRGTNDWEEKTLEFQTGSNTSYIYFYANIWGGYGTFWMDDVTLGLKNTSAPNTPLPIPTTPLPVPTITTPLPAPTPSVIPTPLPTPLPSYILSTDGNKVYAKNGITEKIDYSGTFNQLILSTLKPGNHIYIKDGVYKLDTIELPSDVIMECESNNVIIKTSTDNHLIYLGSNSTIKGCTFEKIGIKSNIIYVYKDVRNWYVTDNHFINTNVAVSIVNPASGFPTNGYGWVLNNTGKHSKLGSIETGRNITFSNNTFVDYAGDEFFDFNGNAHYNTLENNTFTNVDGYYITDEAIDMIGSNTYNVVKNNYIKANFQRGIRPSRKSDHNIIESNYIEYKKGKILNEGGIVLWNSGSIPSEIPSYNIISKNRIIGTTEGIALTGAQYNTVTDNKISNCIKGISITKDTYNGANAVSKNNIISNNTISDIDYGIYISSSPNNVITNNNITNYRIANIFGG